MKFEDLKVLVDRCSKLEDLFFDIQDCCKQPYDEYHVENSTCRHFDEAISIIAESSLSDTLVNLSLTMERINVHEQFDATTLKLG